MLPAGFVCIAGSINLCCDEEPGAKMSENKQRRWAGYGVGDVSRALTVQRTQCFRTKLTSLAPPALAGGFFASSTTWEAPVPSTNHKCKTCSTPMSIPAFCRVVRTGK